MNRRTTASIAANPVLIGAVTVLVVVVAVFLAYNANNGLPFVPTRELKVDVSNGAQLTKGNDVREGGFRIGLLSGIRPVLLRDGSAGATLTLKLDKTDGVLPVDSTVVIRPRSALGLKFIEIHRGHSKRMFADGATLPASQAHVPVQFEDVYSTFDARTRQNSRRNLVGFGGALAGRGNDLNVTIQSLPPLFGHLRPVAANLASPHTDLHGFFTGLERTAGELAPVAHVQTRLLDDLSTTFRAVSSDTAALQATIAKSPGTLSVATRSLRAQRPFLRHTAALSGDLSRAAVELRASLPEIDSALATGTPVLGRTVALDSRLQNAMVALKNLSAAPGTNLALRALTDTVSTLNPQLRFLGPYVTVCNYWNYFWGFVQEHLSEEDGYGYAQRALLNSGGIQNNEVNQQGAVVPANGEGYQPISSARGYKEYAHGQPYTAAVTTGGRADCENGQRGYPEGRLSGSAQPGRFNIVTAPHTPGAQGPTFRGITRVPKGETFQREPNIGAVK